MVFHNRLFLRCAPCNSNHVEHYKISFRLQDLGVNKLPIGLKCTTTSGGMFINPTRATNSGFTLLEIIMVVMIVSVIVSMGLTTLSSTSERMAVGRSADQFVGTHQKARSAALRYGRTSELHMAGGTKFWVQVDTTLNGGGVYDTLGVVVDVSSYEVVFASTASVLCFDLRGLVGRGGSCPTDGASTLVFQRGNAVDSVATTSAGLLLR